MKVRKIAKREPKFITRYWNEEVVRVADVMDRDREQALRTMDPKMISFQFGNGGEPNRNNRVYLPGFDDKYPMDKFTIEFEPQHQPRVIEWINVSSLGDQVQHNIVGGVK
ncbi:hypothetical protein BcepSauron_379 [Burkholderia phage BcepSauron]|uniref:Uncharacterized protein n=1 Tax=Burkholderia phage BcepSauron TaxID=2530033 RepID=A0A482MM74_9CAUD|nr:hypothetical protein H1O17_gp379 [Burkholderia phage BcepSauron]QBQ74759.1 hypothetical protein BcepSauron_379 [Burkholderia phage BcepSauron]